MTQIEDSEETKRTDKKMIFEIIEASCELAARKGEHPLENGCNCIACVNTRKRVLDKPKNWKFRI